MLELRKFIRDDGQSHWKTLLGGRRANSPVHTNRCTGFPFGTHVCAVRDLAGMGPLAQATCSVCGRKAYHRSIQAERCSSTDNCY